MRNAIAHRPGTDNSNTLNVHKGLSLKQENLRVYHLGDEIAAVEA
jgi:hypothetical protein